MTDLSLSRALAAAVIADPEALVTLAQAVAEVTSAANAHDDLMNAGEVADYLGVHVNTVRIWAREGRLPARRMGTKWRFERSAVKAATLPPPDPGPRRRLPRQRPRSRGPRPGADAIAGRNTTPNPETTT